MQLPTPACAASTKPIAAGRPRKLEFEPLKLTDTEVRHVANLANLSLTEEEVARMVHDLDGILAHMDRLATIDTTGIAPMTQVIYDSAATATLRPDVERASLGSELATANAPVAGSGYFKVPLVIEK